MRCRSLVVATLIACGSAKPNVPHVRMTPKSIFDEASPAIVRVEAGNDKVGTGFIIDKAGIVATNLHVVAGEAEINIRMHDGTKYKVLQVAGVDPGRDLALLKIKPASELPAVRLGDSNSLGAGDQVYSISNPLGVFDNSITQGLVSSVRVLCTDQDVVTRAALVAKIGRPADEIHREVRSKHNRSSDEDEMLRVLGCGQELTILQISAAISQGSSGGPLFNQFGEVVGVTTAIITAGQSINLAMPAKYLKPLLAQEPNAMPLAQFAALTKEADEERPHNDTDADSTVPPRQIPNHPVAVWDGCKPTDVEDTIKAVMSAIEIGAPAYNKMTPQGFEECYRIYEGTALRLEQAGACKGVQTAFGDGLLRASAIKSFKDKAWAMRDTFDGLIKVSMGWCAQNQKICPATIQTLLRNP